MGFEYNGVILLTVLITTGIVLLFMFIWEEFIIKINRKIHINKKIIDETYDNVWQWFSNINNYPVLYPNWVDKIEEINKEKYIIYDQYNHNYEAIVKLDKNKGIIDLYMEGEVSKTRLFTLRDNKTLVLHIGEREDFNLLAWLYLKKTVNSDFNNAKKVIESN